MINPIQSINAFSVVTVALSLTPADFKDIPYSPALLLAVCFDASITDDSGFHQSCKWGYEEYFESMYERDQRGRLVFVEKSCELADLLAYVKWVVEGDDLAFIGETVTARVGSALGWLSALALTDRPLALRGLDWLVQWVKCCGAGRL